MATKTQPKVPELAVGLTLDLTPEQGLVLVNVLRQISSPTAAHKIALGEIQQKLETVLSSEEQPTPPKES